MIYWMTLSLLTLFSCMKIKSSLRGHPFPRQNCFSDSILVPFFPKSLVSWFLHVLLKISCFVSIKKNVWDWTVAKGVVSFGWVAYKNVVLLTWTVFAVVSCFGCQFVPAASPLGIRAFGGRGNIAETTRDGAQLDHSVPGRGVGGIAETTTFEDCACFGWYPLLAFRWKYVLKVTIIVENCENYHFVCIPKAQ